MGSKRLILYAAATFFIVAAGALAQQAAIPHGDLQVRIGPNNANFMPEVFFNLR